MKLAVVGTGQIVRELLPHLDGWGWKLEALCSTPRSAEKARSMAAEAGCSAVYSDYAALKAQLHRIGAIKLVSCNFSRYSSRYDSFCAGRHPPPLPPHSPGAR